jgi:hypothetical protein
VEEDDCYLSLFEHVQFEYVSVAVMDRFCSVLDEHLDHLSASMWPGLRRRLVSPVVAKAGGGRYYGLGLLPKEGSPLDGVIAHLTRECGGNVHQKGVVTITGHHYYADNTYPAWSAADLTADSVFYSKDEPNQSLTYDFRDRRLRVTHYSIRSRYDGNDDNYYLRSWVIEGSVDDVTWIEVDRRDNNDRLKGRNATHCFEVQSRSDDFRLVRLVRLRQTGPNHYSSPDHRMVISGFELFGWMIN